ncbi:MAG: spiro-SPASM protein [Spirochaetes bacterium]|nr:spiro-SPASM protein [Spirochaetota bacterium]
MKADILLYIESATSDSDLSFLDMYLPELLARRIQGTVQNCSVYYSVPPSYQGKLSGTASCIVRSGHDDVAFWKELFARTGSDHICKIYADSPFLDPSIIGEMMDLHLTYLAEFTYSENLPAGFSCETVSKELIAAIPELKEQTLPLAQVIKSNLNQFDIEIYYKDPDIRDKRISFRSANRRDALIMERIYRLGSSIPSYESLKGIIEEHPEVLHVGPSYLEIELTGRCDLECLFCYRNSLKQHHGDMEKNSVALVLEQMKPFGLPYTICFGGSGEPLMHPNVYEILSMVAGDPLVETIIVETNGLYADVNYRTHLGSSGEKIKTIVNINGYNSETYGKLHGKEFFDRVHQNILGLAESATGRLYIQIMKINETEPFLDSYYDYWEKLKIPIILQKQNTYLGRIPDRRYSDLSPLDRIPCWHLQRDLYITADGTVTFCKQDVDGNCAQGTMGSSTLAEIWEKKRQAFINDYRKQYPAMPDCKSCDEWYTFNA